MAVLSARAYTVMPETLNGNKPESLPMAQTEGGPVKATQVSFEIVEVIREMDRPGVTELANRLNMPSSTVYDHLKTLENDEYIVKQGDGYRVGMRFLDLGGHARQDMRLFQIAESEIQQLANDTSEHANLMIEEHGMGVFLHTVKGEEAVQLDTHTGRRIHLHTSALGKSILAHLPAKRVDEILNERGLPTVTSKTVNSRDELDAELTEIREHGYAIDDEERVEGMRCVAAPVLGGDDHVYGAVSVSGPKVKLGDSRIHDILANKVLSTVNVLEVNLRYR